MKKIFALILLCLFTTTFVYAQQLINATGTVKDSKGNAIPYAFIRNRPYNSAAYADSVGNFKLVVRPNSSLEVKANGYLEAFLNTGTTTDFQLVLQSANAPGDGPSATPGMAQTVYVQHNTADKDNQNFDYGSALFTPKKEDAHGSLYLFGNWVHGYIINPTDSLVQNSKYLYNYDKIDGDLLITTDGVSAIKVDEKLYKSFVLFDNTGRAFAFERVPSIDNAHYILVLAKGSKYIIYKKIKTHLKQADYSSNGLSSTGNKYDEYIDEGDYYLLDVQSNQIQKIALKKKVLKAAFLKDADKLNKYMSDNSGDIDDLYLANLGVFMNE